MVISPRLYRRFGDFSEFFPPRFRTLSQAGEKLSSFSPTLHGDGPMSVAADTNPQACFCYPAATLYLRGLVACLVERVSLQLLLVITIGGFVLYSGVVGASV